MIESIAGEDGEADRVAGQQARIAPWRHSLDGIIAHRQAEELVVAVETGVGFLIEGVVGNVHQGIGDGLAGVVGNRAGDIYRQLVYFYHHIRGGGHHRHRGNQPKGDFGWNIQFQGVGHADRQHIGEEEVAVEIGQHPLFHRPIGVVRHHPHIRRPPAAADVLHPARDHARVEVQVVKGDRALHFNIMLVRGGQSQGVGGWRVGNDHVKGWRQQVDDIAAIQLAAGLPNDVAIAIENIHRGVGHRRSTRCINVAAQLGIGGGRLAEGLAGPGTLAQPKAFAGLGMRRQRLPWRQGGGLRAAGPESGCYQQPGQQDDERDEHQALRFHDYISFGGLEKIFLANGNHPRSARGG